jgi:hypothetical protein
MSGLGSGAGCFGNWDCTGRNKQSIQGKVIKWTAPVQTFCFFLSIDGPCQSLVLWPNLWITHPTTCLYIHLQLVCFPFPCSCFSLSSFHAFSSDVD